VTPARQEVAHGSLITVTAEANRGWRFTGWADGAAAGPRREVREAIDLVAQFEPERYQVTARAEPKEGGRVTPARQEVAHGSLITVTAEANRGWRFTGWADGSGTGARRAQVVGQDLNLVALFAVGLAWRPDRPCPSKARLSRRASSQFRVPRPVQSGA